MRLLWSWRDFGAATLRYGRDDAGDHALNAQVASAQDIRFTVNESHSPS